MLNLQKLLRFVRSWQQDERGASTVEFVILLPFMISFLGLVATASLYLALSSDVQQLAYEMARASLPDAESTTDTLACDDLGTRWVTPLAANLPLLDPARVSDVACRLDPDTKILQVAVQYDTRGTLGSILGAAIGLEFDSFTRSSFVRW